MTTTAKLWYVAAALWGVACIIDICTNRALLAALAAVVCILNFVAADES
jgi:hypothetical protein